MKKQIMVVCIFFSFWGVTLHAENYAILISAGKATTDSLFDNSFYWYELVSAYHTLVEELDYSHQNVFTFYGDGVSFNSQIPKYTLSHYNWPEIVDYNNAKSNIFARFDDIGNIVGEEDNILIWWVAGHGFEPSGADDYKAYIKNRAEKVYESEIKTLVDKIDNYKRKKILWKTCYSGCLVKGNINLHANNTVIITSSDWDKKSAGWLLGNPLTNRLMERVVFNYVINNSLCNENLVYGGSYSADLNNDECPSLNELYQKCITVNNLTAQLSDISTLSNKIFVQETLNMDNVSLINNIEYEVDNLHFNNVTLNNGTVNIKVDKDFSTSGEFSVPLGSSLSIE